MLLVYSSLDRASDEIRIFHLGPGQRDDQISGKLEVYPFESSPPYEALSYCWGSLLMPVDISINEQTFSLHRNLYDALRFLRYTDTTRTLWIDAICIDQSDQQERLHQVKIMADIYLCATTVLVWLGPPSEGSDKVMDLIRETAAEFEPKSYKQREHFDTLAPHAADLLQLLHRDYWFRVWIVQEVAMARTDPVVGCGSKWLPWSLMSDGLLEIRARFRWRASETYDVEERTLCYHCHAVLGGFFDLKEIRESVKPGMAYDYPHPLGTKTNALDLLWRTSDKHSTEPRDRVYSLLGMLRSLQSGDIIVPELDPDYSRSVRSVFIMATKMIIRLDRNLEILHMRNHLPSAFLPSWTPDFSSRTHTTYPALAGTTWGFWFRRIGCVYKTKQIAFKRSELPTMDDQDMLVVGGRHFDVVARIVDLSDFLTFPHLTIQRVDQTVERYENCGTTSGQHDSPYTLEAVWRTLVANTGWASEYPCSIDYGPAFCKLRTGSSLEEMEPGDVHNSGIEGFIANVEVTISSGEAGPYRTFIVTERGRFGLAPPDCNVGDHLCTLKNFSTPAILRYYGSYHAYVGTAYVHDVMHGEGYADLRDDPEHFHLL